MINKKIYANHSKKYIRRHQKDHNKITARKSVFKNLREKIESVAMDDESARCAVILRLRNFGRCCRFRENIEYDTGFERDPR